MAGVRANLDTLFARHMLQVVDSLLLAEVFGTLAHCCHRGPLRVADIGSGMGAATIAVIGVARHLMGLLQARRDALQVGVVLNDISGPALTVGRYMVRGAASPPGERTICARTLTLSAPFPRCTHQLRRAAQAFGGYDLVLMSYALAPMKESASYGEIAAGLTALTTPRSLGTCGVLLQDRFHESMARRLASELAVACRKITIRQEVLEPSDSRTPRSYTFLRSAFAKPGG
jgi:hypothetical protein